MKKTFIFFSSAMMLLSCANNADSNSSITDDTATKSTSPTADNETLTSECYAQVGRDTVLLQINTKNDGVNGTLYIHYDGKDVNQGHLVGTMKGDTLLADYTFYSEGVQSVRQVAFLKKEDAMVEGFGEVEEKDNKMMFKDSTTLKFNDKMKLAKVNCAR